MSRQRSQGQPDPEVDPQTLRRPGWWLGLAIAGLVTAVLAVGALAAAGPLARETGLRTAGVAPSTIAPTVLDPLPTPGATTTTTSGGATPRLAESAEPVRRSATATPAELQRRLSALPRQQGGRAGLMVLDPATGAVLVQDRATDLLIPASNMKTLVTAAVLARLGPDHRFTTRVVSPAPGRVVLVGGGDPYLGKIANPRRPRAATTADLAAATAKHLLAQGVRSVTVGYDSSLFTGPTWHPTWPAGYADQVAQIQALSIDAGRQLNPAGLRVPGTGLSQDPGRDAATAFTAQLAAHGITVTAEPTPQAAAGAATIAQVPSMPLIDIATEVMVSSDNFGAEVLFRQLALASGQSGSFAGGQRALQRILTEWKLMQAGATTLDGSGLSRGNRVSAVMLARSWQRIVAEPRLRGLLISTPVAGVTGTLAGRFLPSQGSQAGRGWVRAKTGTLTGVSSLSGWTVSVDGQPLVLAGIVNDSTNDWWARAWLDQVASVITSCGCR